MHAAVRNAGPGRCRQARTSLLPLTMPRFPRVHVRSYLLPRRFPNGRLSRPCEGQPCVWTAQTGCAACGSLQGMAVDPGPGYRLAADRRELGLLPSNAVANDCHPPCPAIRVSPAQQLQLPGMDVFSRLRKTKDAAQIASKALSDTKWICRAIVPASPCCVSSTGGSIANSAIPGSVA